VSAGGKPRIDQRLHADVAAEREHADQTGAAWQEVQRRGCHPVQPVRDAHVALVFGSVGHLAEQKTAVRQE
jgi:hypothetical protein